MNSNKHTISRFFISGLLAVSTTLLLNSRLSAEDHKHSTTETHDETMHDETTHKKAPAKNDADDHEKEAKHGHDTADKHEKDAEKQDEKHKEGEDDGHGHGESASDVELSKDHMRKAGIQTMRLEKKICQ